MQIGGEPLDLGSWESNDSTATPGLWGVKCGENHTDHGQELVMKTKKQMMVVIMLNHG
jgi:hypothetical protein